ncbi:hypothetical protein [Xenorhabdus sp. SGI240]|uniref:hypothetical protein n=1 Tax=Xenorhabdus sp. SGI240 TaxID=3158262 RepID=UPI0032B7996C
MLNTTQVEELNSPQSEEQSISNHALFVARMYDSLTDEQRQRFLESIREEEQKDTDRHLSGKSKAS